MFGHLLVLLLVPCCCSALLGTPADALLAELNNETLALSDVVRLVRVLAERQLALEKQVDALQKGKTTQLESCARPDDAVAPEEVHPGPTRTINFIYGLWDTKPMSADFAANMKTWQKLNPGWAVKLWDKKMVRSLWASAYPTLKDLWKKVRPIQRADIARLMIILQHGGAYADLDCAPSKALDDIFGLAGFRDVQHSAGAPLPRPISHAAVVCVEDEHSPETIAGTASWAIRKGVPEHPTRIANYVFWGKPGSPLFQRALDLAVSRVRSLKDKDYAVTGAPHMNNPYSIIYSTGPDVLTEATFPIVDGKRTTPYDTLVIPKGKCSMINRATGTWIGDDHPAWDKAL